MPAFRYRAKDGVKIVEGNIEAQSKPEAVDKVYRMGLVPVLVEAAPESVSRQPRAVSLSSRGIRPKDVTVFTGQLGSLMKAGVPILKCLQIIARQTGNQLLRQKLETLATAVKDGKTLSAAMGDEPGIFPSLYVAMIRSGEKAGNLPNILAKVASHRQKQEETMARIKTAMAYPVLMSLVGLGTIIFMFTFVMPKMMETFSSIDQKLPAPTLMMIGLHDILMKSWIYLLAGFVVMVLIIRETLKNPSMRLGAHLLQLRLPVIGEFIQKSELARFCGTLEMLIRSGVPILQALETSIPTVTNDALRAALGKSCGDLKEGGSLGQSLESSGIFPVFMTSLIVVGEESGNLAEGLGEIAEGYTKDTEEQLKLITSLFEPVIILVMGLVVGFIVISMLLPIFQINFAAA